MLVRYGPPAVEKLFRTAFKLRPGLGKRASEARTTADIEAIFREAVGVLDAHAATGSIDIDNVLLTAIRAIRFNHEDGTVAIECTTMKAPVIRIGGEPGATGTTKVTDTTLEAGGSKAVIEKGAAMGIDGGANITMA